MLYDILTLLLAMLGAYGAYVLIVRYLPLEGREEDFGCSPGIHVDCGYREEELYDLLLSLRATSDDGAEPVLLIDCPLRREVLCELSELGARMYVSYEEYYREKRT